MKEAYKYSSLREESLTPELKRVAVGYRKKLKEWEKKYKPSEEDIRKAKGIIGSIKDAQIPPDASKNFRYYLYQYQSKRRRRSGKK